MPVMVRVEKFKNLQNKACLPSLLCYLLCPGVQVVILFFVCVCVSLWDSKSIKDSPQNPHRFGRLWCVRTSYVQKTGFCFYFLFFLSAHQEYMRGNITPKLSSLLLCRSEVHLKLWYWHFLSPRHVQMFCSMFMLIDSDIFAGDLWENIFIF